MRTVNRPVNWGNSNSRGYACVASCANKNCFLGNPPAKPVSDPLTPTTRWHGTMMLCGFWPIAAPTARTAFGFPMWRAISP